MTEEWDLREHLALIDSEDVPGARVSADEWRWIDYWDEWVKKTREMLIHEADRDGRDVKGLPGFPIWANVWTTDEEERQRELKAAAGMAWKVGHLTKNYDLYDRLRSCAPAWMARWLGTTRQFPESRRKFEWQAQDAASVHECVISLRPSGPRVKRLTHLPALVASPSRRSSARSSAASHSSRAHGSKACLMSSPGQGRRTPPLGSSSAMA